MEQLNNKERIILGIDPGTAVMGYGLLKEIGTKIELISLGVVKMEKMDDHMLKLQRIFEKTVALIDNYQPDCLAIEATFRSEDRADQPGCGEDGENGRSHAETPTHIRKDCRPDR